MFASLLTKILPFKGGIIGIAFALVVGFATIQTVRIDAYQAEVTLLKANETKYLATIETQKGIITDIQDLVNKNEQAFQEYVAAQKDRVQIIKEAQIVYVERGKENEVGIVDQITSDKIKGFFNNRFTELQDRLEGPK